MESRSSGNAPAFVVPTGLLTFVLLAVLVFLAIYQMESPQAAGTDAPATAFSAARAAQHLEVIAQSPHPLASLENAKVRDYLISELTSHGLTPQIQTTDVHRVIRRISPQTGEPVERTLSGTVNNVLARIEGSANTDNAIAIAAHYDSVEAGPGTSDDAAAVAAMIEVARALGAGTPLRNDLILLFTDGEESGLLGAKGFVDQHPWAKDVKVIFNFEARGTTGPSYMFETSDNNGWLIGEFAKADAYPVGYSFTYDVYKLLPNDTDLTMFRAGNMAGFGFAFIDGLVHYHTENDTIANLNPRSLQHHGVHMLSLAQHFGNISLDNTSAPNRVYFTFFGLVLHYPYALNVPLMILVTLVFLGVLVLGLRRGRLSWGGLAGGFFSFLLVMIVSLLGVFAISFLIPLLHPQPLLLPRNGGTYNSHLYTISFITLALAITSALYILLRRRVRLNNLIVGAWLWWLILLIVTTLTLPGTSYLFAWPLLLGLIALAVRFTARDEDAPMPTLLLVLLPAISGIFLLTPLIRGLFVALNIGLYVPLLLFVVLLGGLLLPHLTLITLKQRWAFPAAAAIGGLGLLVFAALTAGAGA
jgi:hypothetical protein